MKTEDINILTGEELDGTPEDDDVKLFMLIACIEGDLNLLEQEIIPPQEAVCLRELAERLTALAEKAEKPF